MGSVSFSLPFAKDTSRLAFVAATTVVIHVVQLPGNELHTLDLRLRSFGLRTVDAQHFFALLKMSGHGGPQSHLTLHVLVLPSAPQFATRTGEWVSQVANDRGACGTEQYM